MATRKAKAPKMLIDVSTLAKPPQTSSPLELALCLMREAEAQEPGEEGKFRAMDCHTDILTLGDHSKQVQQELAWSLYRRIGANQFRLHIV